MSDQKDKTVILSTEEYALLKDTAARQAGEIVYLKHQLSELQRMIYGTRSERFVTNVAPGQFTLEFGEDGPEKQQEQEQTEDISYTRKKGIGKQDKGHGRDVLPAHLPRKEEIIEPDNIPDGSVKIGEEITERLEYTTGKVWVLRTIRTKYALPKNQGVVIAPMPEQVFPKCKAGLSLIVYILVSKFVDHMPLYRIIQQFKREKVELSESTMGDWTRQSIDLLAILHERLRELLRSSEYLQGDESPIPVLTEDKPGATHKGYLWAFHAPLIRLVLFDYHKGRDQGGPREMLEDYTGSLQTDGYTVYDYYERERSVYLLACMAHARRRFEHAKDQDKKRSEEMMQMFGSLYHIEQIARDQAMGFERRKKLRQEKSLPILQEMEKWMKENLQQVLPKSAIGEAITYTLGQWKWLLRYLEDGKYEIDNNLIENTIRPIALGRKNYLFAGSHEAAQRTAIIYSFLGSCKLNGINPTQWLTDVLTRIQYTKPSQLDELLPNNWKASHSESVI